MLRKRVAFFVAFLTLVLTSSLLFAEDTTEEDKNKLPFRYVHQVGVNLAYYPGTHKGYQLVGDFDPANMAKVLPSFWESLNGNSVVHGRKDAGSNFSVELKSYYKFQMEFAAMRANNPLMDKNNIKINIIGNLSPVSFDAGFSVEITPLAVLSFRVGTEVTLGWFLPGLNVDGLAITTADIDWGTYDGFSLTSENAGQVNFLSMTKLGATFQFDFGAVFKGDWTHVVIVADAEFRYQYFSRAGNTDATRYWIHEGDAGENENGWMMNATMLLGYLMPKKPGYLNLIGFVTEMEDLRLEPEAYNRSTEASGGWGSDYVVWKFGPTILFDFPDGHSLQIVAEFKNQRNYTDATTGDSDFRDRHVDTTNPEFIQFDRIAFVWKWQFGKSPNYKDAL